jgi:hypothetical protein
LFQNVIETLKIIKMKKALFSLLLVFAASALTNSAVAQEVKNGAQIEFQKETHDYGTIKYAGDGTCEFKFTNTGNAPLIISNAKGSCGCTVPDWPRDPVMPGKSAVIKVKYDTKRPGAINKSVTITSNAGNSPTKVIRIKGNVGAKPTSGVPVQTGGPAN